MRSIAAALAALAAVLALSGCLYIAPSPTYVVPPNANVICPGGAPATFSSGVYRC